MTSKAFVRKAENYYLKFTQEKFVISDAIPIVYFGDLEAYSNSETKIITVGKNPSSNEFRLGKSDLFSLCRFPDLVPDRSNLSECWHMYFEKRPLEVWFSCYKQILNGLDASFYRSIHFRNTAIHTDICSLLATDPSWSKLNKNEQQILFDDGYAIWKELIEELQPDIMLMSVPKALLERIVLTRKSKILTLTFKKDGTPRKRAYDVISYNYKLKSGKESQVIWGQAANKPFGLISNEQKVSIANAIRENW